MDAVQKTNSGHLGVPMGMVDTAEVLWNDLLKHNPQNPGWADRDRLILSSDHVSMLSHSLLHLIGHDLPLSEFKQFCQLHLRMPDHPGHGYTPGVGTTIGPLGRGPVNVVGVAVAECTLAVQFNRPGYEIIDYHVWVFMDDGCPTERISHGVCSLTDTLGLGKLTGFRDYNGVPIDGEIEGWFSDDVAGCFHVYHWHVIGDVDGYDPQAVRRAIVETQVVRDKLLLIIYRTIIGFGPPNRAGSEKPHGTALDEKEMVPARQQPGQRYPPLEIPKEIYQGWDACPCGEKAEYVWSEKFAAYQQQFLELVVELTCRMNGILPKGLTVTVRDRAMKLQAEPVKIASHRALQNALNVYGPHLPKLLGGSTDLAPSNLTTWSGSTSIKDDPVGNYTYYGIREFGMTVVTSGVALHGGFTPYTSTSLMFVEYTRDAVRMAALMKARQIMIYTHDSIGFGGGDPTHQVVEQLTNLRLTSNFSIWRPRDQAEITVTWRAAIAYQNGPMALILSRQSLAQTSHTPEQVQAIVWGGYVLKDVDGRSDLVSIVAGSEAKITVLAAEKLLANGVDVWVVSFSSIDVSDAQDEAWRESVLPSDVSARVAVEAGVADHRYKYVGLKGKIVGMTGYGKPAPVEQLLPFFGFMVDRVVATVGQTLNG